jgi:hypothetical protein
MKRDLYKYEKALDLRTNGKSILYISKELHISKSTASKWCKEVVLTDEQKTTLASRSQNIELLKFFARKRHEDKLNRHKSIAQKAQKEVKKLKRYELFLVGIALYWAEGFKNISEGRIGFCNSDPRMIKFMISWFKDVLKIPLEDFTLRVEFNAEHLDRKECIEDYWVNITEIPKSQFNKPFLQKAKMVRKYANRNQYFGVLRIRIRRSSELLVKIRAWIDSMSLAY